MNTVYICTVVVDHNPKHTHHVFTTYDGALKYISCGLSSANKWDRNKNFDEKQDTEIVLNVVSGRNVINLNSFKDLHDYFNSIRDNEKPLACFLSGNNTYMIKKAPLD